MQARATKRLEKEMVDLTENYKQFELKVQEGDVTNWEVTFYGPKESIYKGEKFILQFHFDGDYPISAPLVKFKPPFMPKHEHVYSNGFICLSTLYDDWTPSLRVSSVCLSVQSMISSAKVKMHPPGYDSLWHYKDPRKLSWIYEDLKCFTFLPVAKSVLLPSDFF